MNLCEFLEDIHPDSYVIVEMDGKIIFASKVHDIAEEDSCMYWIKSKSIMFKEDGIIHISVEDEEAVDREIEENLKRRFSNILSNIIDDYNSSELIKEQLLNVIKSAKQFSQRKKADEHDLFISELNKLSENITDITGKEPSWRGLLGDDRNRLGDFAEYINDYADKIKLRIGILEAIIWAQEHHNQVMDLSDNAMDYADFKNQLTVHYGFEEDQACAIIDMRNKAFTVHEKKRTQEELQKLLTEESIFRGINKLQV